MKHIYISILCLFVLSCGQHEQVLERFSGKRKATTIAEAGPIEAVESGNLDRLKREIEEGLSIDAKTPEGVTLLMLAVKNKQFAILEYLLSLEASKELKVSRGEDEGKTAFDFVGGSEDEKNILTSLLNQSALEPQWLHMSVFEYIKLRNVDNVRWLFSKGADVNYKWARKKLTPLISLFTLIKGVKEDDAFAKVEELFSIITKQEGVDVNIKFGRKTALKRCQSRARRDHAGYKTLVDRLKAMGAE